LAYNLQILPANTNQDPVTNKICQILLTKKNQILLAIHASNINKPILFGINLENG
jgi:hypothetical protein